MKDSEVRRAWEQNAEAWTQLSRLGYNVCRDEQITPAFLAMLPSVDGLLGLDVGCGEGQSTRLLAARGARMISFDIAGEFIRAARAEDPQQSTSYLVASARRLPFASGSFHFATAFMSLMDVGGPECSLADLARVLKPGGFLQFSIVHPCFAPPLRRVVKDDRGMPVAIEVGRYFDREEEIEHWTFSSAPAAIKQAVRPFAVPRFHRTLADWLNAIHAAGLHLEHCLEPEATPDTAARYPILADTRIAPNFLLLRCRRPNTTFPD